MARRTLFNIKERILQTAVQIGAQDGVENITARKIAEKCDITDATVFVYYKTKINLLANAYAYVCNWINKAIDSFSDRAAAEKSFGGEAWKNLFDSFVSNSEYPGFYCNYRYSGRRFSDSGISQNQLDLCRRIVAEKNIGGSFKEDDLCVIWENTLESVSYYAIKVAEGRIPNTARQYEIIKNLLFEGGNAELNK